MVVSHKKKLIFIHIPKCAGNSISENFYDKSTFDLHNLSTQNTFIKFLYYKNNIMNKIIHNLCVINFSNMIDEKYLIAHLPMNLYVNKGLITKEQYRQYYSFAVIRNPYDRFYSMYKFLYSSLKLTPIDFVSYVKNIFKNKDNDNRYHFFQPQYIFICDKNYNLVIDKIIRFENLDFEYSKLVKKYKLNKLYHLNKSDDVIGFDNFYSNNFIKKNVYKLYKKDFEIFNYEKN